MLCRVSAGAAASTGHMRLAAAQTTLDNSQCRSQINAPIHATVRTSPNAIVATRHGTPRTNQRSRPVGTTAAGPEARPTSCAAGTAGSGFASEGRYPALTPRSSNKWLCCIARPPPARSTTSGSGRRLHQALRPRRPSEPSSPILRPGLTDIAMQTVFTAPTWYHHQTD